ncbi:MAG: hypothetical protein GX091_00430 [Peptococcaceae bacterium]|nr:hypothetical protein [Peptococcaceae bacterium]
MPEVIKILLWLAVMMGLFFVFKIFFLFILPILLLLYAVYALYQKYLYRGPKRMGNKFDIFWSNFHRSYGSGSTSQQYTTVIDADNMEREYKIPKI